MSGQPKPGTAAAELGELIRQAHEALKDLRAETRAAREARAALDALLSGGVAVAAVKIEEQFELILAAMGARRDAMVETMAKCVPVKTACPACGLVVAGLVDLTTPEMQRECLGCGRVSVLRLTQKIVT